MAQTGTWNLARENVLQDRGALLKEDGDVIREYKAMNEENFVSSWLRKEGKARKKETKEDTSKKRIREEETQENETVIVKRSCVNPVSTEAL